MIVVKSTVQGVKGEDPANPTMLLHVESHRTDGRFIVLRMKDKRGDVVAVQVRPEDLHRAIDNASNAR